ncbi:nitrate ABC transporter permease [Immundisolibacter cernigliae]|uniref:Nitrate ABC transporter, permease protein n=1 Tax=Immundisolibacter cernigliae TaxID=1810504 RepID=A0A1B1YPY5_9GAMM|nr:nitrate ABC transporter permease [Immundisolibacter cernigliae]ANX02830.1 nitrate ABC transporter, permease protein [Immundisolibacter cernigliae]
MAAVIPFVSAAQGPVLAPATTEPAPAGAATVPGGTPPAPHGPAWLRASGPNPRAQAFARQAIAAAVGLLVLVALWSLLAANTRLPGPAATWVSAVELFSDPFYRNSPNDQGIGWNVLASLRRVALGFGAAALVGIPLGFVIGRFRFLGDAAGPVISLLRPVSPLAWLPIGLLLFRSAEPSAIFAIFICSIWPMIINTASGVQQVPREYLDVARVLRLSEWTVFRRILLPSSLPHVLTGVRLSVGIAWLVIVAAEMLTGGVGIGFWVWDEWNNLNVEHILIAIFVIGAVGLLLEQALLLLARRLP